MSPQNHLPTQKREAAEVPFLSGKLTTTISQRISFPNEFKNDFYHTSQFLGERDISESGKGRGRLKTHSQRTGKALLLSFEWVGNFRH